MDIMLDLETMGTAPNAAIVAIGAVVFDPVSGELKDEFYTQVRLKSSMESGAKVDANTVIWWLQQSEEARSALFASEALSIGPAVRYFASWVRGCVNYSGDVRVWGGCGAPFDNVILRSAFESVGETPPWHFWEDRCYRTLKALIPAIPLERTIGVHHNALDDAKNQARHAIQLLQYIQGVGQEGPK